jgi:hypothetical protein
MLAIGVRPEQPPHIRERLRLFNATLYTASAVPVVYLVVAVPAFNHPVVWYGVLMAVAGLVGIATGLTLIHLQRFNLGYSLAGIVGWLCGLGLVVTHGSLSGAAILLLSAPGGSILTVGRSFFAKMKFYLTPLLIATVAVVVWGPRHPVVGPPFTEHQLVFLAAFFFVLMFAALSSWNVRTARAIFRLRDQLKVEHAKSEALLLNVLPLPIATRMKAGEQMIADHFDEVTVIFADIVGFTRLAEELTPKALLELLDELFLAFDQLAIEHGLEKIKTVGDGYMAAAGIPVPRVDHVVAANRYALRSCGRRSHRQDQVCVRSVGRHGEHGCAPRVPRSAGRDPSIGHDPQRAQRSFRYLVPGRGRPEGQRTDPRLAPSGTSGCCLTDRHPTVRGPPLAHCEPKQRAGFRM